MSVVAGAIGSAAAGLLGNAANLGGSIYSTERNIEHASEEAAINRQFQYYMSSSQYQRAVQDMEKAGLNPAAIGAGMSPASSVAGSAATGNYGHAVSGSFGNLFSTAAKAAMAEDKNVANKIIQEMKSETALEVQSLKNEGAIQNEIQKKALGHSAYQAANNKKEYSASKSDVPWKEL